MLSRICDDLFLKLIVEKKIIIHDSTAEIVFTFLAFELLSLFEQFCQEKAIKAINFIQKRSIKIGAGGKLVTPGPD